MALLTDRPTLPDGADEFLRSVRASAGTDPTITRAPFTGEPLATLPTSTVDDVRAAAAAARRAQVAWAAVPVSDRARIVGRIHDLCYQRREQALDLLQLEGGKTRYDAFLEAIAAPVYASYLRKVAPGVLAPQRRRGLTPLITQPVEHRLPVGLVGLITAWNFPVVFAAADGYAALVAGNAILHLPDPQTFLSAMWARSLAIEAGVPADVWQVVQGPGAELGPAVVDQVDHVAFTGSTRVGRLVAEQAGRRLIGASLELGGKNCLVVLPDADVDAAAAAAVRATFTNTGQACVGTERALVAAELAEQFTATLVARTQALRLGAGLGFGYDMGCLVNQHQLDKVQRHVEDAVTKGARVLTGGRARPDLGPFAYEPTVLTGTRPGMLVHDEETFGPVLAVETFDTVDAAVAKVNDTEYGLHTSLFTRDVAAARRLAARLHVGTVEINDGYVATWGSCDTPQGGMKASGLGRRNGRDGILRFTHAQSVTAQRMLPLHPPTSISHERYAHLLAVGLKALNRLGLR
jgi:succinate-semialdehyde dehydrogenase/glutarate-semialdehyde dehydrogenase